MAGKSKPTADDLVAEALKSVERIENERKGQAPEDDDIDLDAVEVLPPKDTPPSATDDGSADADDSDEEILIDDDDAGAGQSGGGATKGDKKSDPILEMMIAAKNEAVEALAQTQKEAKSLQERLQRVSADFENYKKRQNREKEEAIRFANEKLLKELMPILDNMARATTAGQQAVESGQEGAAKTILEGTAMVLKQFEESLGRFGIRAFEAMGKPFDPALHEAVGAREDTSVPNQTVIEEYQRGFMLHDRLARPAMVVVSSGGPTKGTAPNSDASENNEEAEDSGDAEG